MFCQLELNALDWSVVKGKPAFRHILDIISLEVGQTPLFLLERNLAQ